MAKAQKWSFLKGLYPKLGIDPDQRAIYQAFWDSPADALVTYSIEKVEHSGKDDALRVKDMDNENLCERYNKARILKDKFDAVSSILDGEIQAMTRLFVERFEDDGVTSCTFDSGISIGTSEEPYPQVKDKVKFLAWIHEKGLAGLLTLNPQTMASLVKDRLIGKVNEPLPPGVEVFMKPKLTRRGGGKETAEGEDNG